MTQMRSRISTASTSTGSSPSSTVAADRRSWPRISPRSPSNGHSRASTDSNGGEVGSPPGSFESPQTNSPITTAGPLDVVATGGSEPSIGCTTGWRSTRLTILMLSTTRRGFVRRLTTSTRATNGRWGCGTWLNSTRQKRPPLWASPSRRSPCCCTERPLLCNVNLKTNRGWGSDDWR